MKGSQLITLISLILVIVICTVMAIFSIENSASQNHWGELDFLLYAFLLCVIIPSTLLYNKAKDKELELTKLFWIRVKLKHALSWMMFAFCGILIFGVNSTYIIDLWLFTVKVSTLHFIFTGAGILIGNFIILFYAKSRKERRLSYFQVAFSLIGFGLGFLLDIYSTTWAEVFAAIPIGYTFYLINKK